MEPQVRQRDEPKRLSKAEQERILKRIKRCEVGTGVIDVSDAFNESDNDEVANHDNTCMSLFWSLLYTSRMSVLGKMGGLS